MSGIGFLAAALTVVLVLQALSTYRSAPREARKRMDALWRSIGLPLSDEETALLLPIVARRVAWPTFGAVAGYLVIGLPVTLSVTQADPAYGDISLLLGVMAATGYLVGQVVGGLTAHLLVGLRSFPQSTGSVRTARPGAREIADYVSTARLRLWRATWWALPLALLLALTLLVAHHGVVERLIVILLLAASSLSVASWVVVQVLLGRRLPSGSENDLRWREALLADTLNQIGGWAAGLGVLAVVATLGAVWALGDSTLPLSVGGALVLTALTVVMGARFLRDRRIDPAPPALRWQGATL